MSVRVQKSLSYICFSLITYLHRVPVSETPFPPGLKPPLKPSGAVIPEEVTIRIYFGTEAETQEYF